MGESLDIQPSACISGQRYPRATEKAIVERGCAYRMGMTFTSEDFPLYAEEVCLPPRLRHLSCAFRFCPGQIAPEVVIERGVAMKTRDGVTCVPTSTGRPEKGHSGAVATDSL